MAELNRIVLDNAGAVTLVVAALAVAGLALAVVVMARTSSTVRRFDWIRERAGEGADNFEAMVKAVQDNARAIDRLQLQIGDLIAEGRTHYKRLGLVRYDAFDGVAGQQSYSLCILDDLQNGVLISNLVGSNFNRGYAVEIRGGEAARKLGDEETRALAAAVENSRTGVPVG